jgi:hypothetical protein
MISCEVDNIGSYFFILTSYYSFLLLTPDF